MSDHWPVIFAITLLALATVGVASAARRRSWSAPARPAASGWAHDAARDLIALSGRLRAVATDPRTPRRAR